MSEEQKPEQPEELELSTKLKEKRVRLDGQPYLIKEMTIEVKEQYLQEQRKRYEVVDGVSMVSDFKGYMGSLICRCLFAILPSTELRPVSSKELAAWSQSCVEQLYKYTQEINALNLEGVEAAKKD